MDRGELGRFLRTRREALLPADVGLATSGRRRTPGLRRAEVAFMAEISVEYYERLEQGRVGRPSEKLLTAIAEALRLDLDERNYVYNLAGYSASARSGADDEVEPALLFLLDSLTNVPGHVVDNLGTVLAQNDLSVVLFGPWAGLPGRRANGVWRWFTEPEARARNFLEDDPATGRQYVAILRAASAALGHDRAAHDLIADLNAVSAEFARYWAETEVAPIRSTDKLLVHPEYGGFAVHCDATVSSTTGQQLLVMRPQAGTGTAERFALLAQDTEGGSAATV